MFNNDKVMDLRIPLTCLKYTTDRTFNDNFFLLRVVKKIFFSEKERVPNFRSEIFGLIGLLGETPHFLTSPGFMKFLTK